MLKKEKNCWKAILSGIMTVTVAFTSMVIPTTVSAEQAEAGTIQAELFVSPGKTGGDGSYGKPFGSVEEARNAIRSINKNMTGDIVVFLAEGEYYVDETVLFTNEDSASNGHKIIYRNLDEIGSAEIIGGSKVDGQWALVERTGADADLPAAAEGHVYKTNVGTNNKFNTLYVNGKRATLARTQNLDQYQGFEAALTPYMRSEGGGVGDLIYKAGDIDAESIQGMINAKKRGDLNASVYMWDGGYWDWMTDTIPISSIDAEKRKLTFRTVNGRPEMYRPKYAVRNNARYFIQGNLGFLDVPGEYYFNKKTGDLYYYPESGSVEDQEVIIPKVKEIIRVEGASRDDMVTGIEFSGLKFMDTDTTDWYTYGWNFNDAGEGLKFYPEEAKGSTQPSYCEQTERSEFQYGSITLKNTNGISISKCHITNTGMFGIDLYLANQNTRIEDSRIDRTGHGGVNIDGGYPGVAGDENGDGYSRDNVVTNTMIHDIGELIGQASGLTVQQSSYNTFSNLEIFNSPRRGLFITAGHSRNPNGDFPTDDFPVGDKNFNIMTDMYSHHNTFEYCYVYNCQQDGGDDGAFFGCYLYKGKDHKPNYINQMVLDSTGGNPTMTDLGPNNMNLDMGCSGMELSNIKSTNPMNFNMEVNTILQYGDKISFDNTNIDYGTFKNQINEFDDSKMEYDKIGITADFPKEYLPEREKKNEFEDIWFEEEFEQDLDWMKWSYQGTEPKVQTQWMSGGPLEDRQGLELKPKSALTREFKDVLHKKISVSMFDRQSYNLAAYDSARQNSGQATSFAMAGNENASVGIGVDWDNKSNYIIRNGDQVVATDVERTFGWHDFTFDFSEAGKAVLWIDGVEVGSYSIDGFQNIGMFCEKGTTYYDSFVIYGGEAADVPGSIVPPEPPVYDSSNENKQLLSLDMEGDGTNLSDWQPNGNGTPVVSYEVEGATPEVKEGLEGATPEVKEELEETAPEVKEEFEEAAPEVKEEFEDTEQELKEELEDTESEVKGESEKAAEKEVELEVGARTEEQMELVLETEAETEIETETETETETEMPMVQEEERLSENNVGLSVSEISANKIAKISIGDNEIMYGRDNQDWTNYMVNLKWKFDKWGNTGVLEEAYDNFTIKVMTTKESNPKNSSSYQVVFRRNKNGSGNFPANTPYFEIMKRKGGDVSLGTVALPDGFDLSAWHEIQIQTFAGKVGFVLDGEKMLDVSDGDLTYGGIALGGINADVYVDDLQMIANPTNVEYPANFGLENATVNGKFHPEHYGYYAQADQKDQPITLTQMPNALNGTKVSIYMNQEEITSVPAELTLKPSMNRLVFKEETAAGTKEYTVMIDNSKMVKEVGAIASVRTEAGTTPVLPDTVSVTFEDGTKDEAAIGWNMVNPNLYKTPGVFTAKGVLKEYGTKVSTDVLVEGLVSIGSLESIRTDVGTVPSLPGTVAAEFSNGTKDLPLKFQTMAPALFEQAGTVFAIAGAEGYLGTVLQKIEIAPKKAIEGISLSKTELVMKPGDKVTIEVTVLPEGVEGVGFDWVTSDEKVVTVKNGEVTALAEGVADITVSCGGKTAVCKVKVVGQAPSENPGGSSDETQDPIENPKDESKKPGEGAQGPKDELQNPGGEPNILVEKVELPSSMTVAKGKEASIQAKVVPANASNKKLIFKSNNPKVATVDENGKVKGRKAGEAVVTATAQDESGKSKSCKVTVAEIKLNAESFPLQVGKTTNALKVDTKYPSNDKIASWSSSDKKIVTVDKKGKIKGVKTGKATITVKMKSGTKASCKVNVQKTKVTTKSLSGTVKKVNLKKGKSVTLKIVRKPISATEKITFVSSDDKVVSVDKNGKIKAKKYGTATVTATTSNGKKTVCKVVVPNVTLKKTSATLKVNGTVDIQFKSMVPAKDAVAYTCSDEAVVSVDKKGKVKAKKTGKATITVKTKSGAKATFKVTVK